MLHALSDRLHVAQRVLPVQLSFVSLQASWHLTMCSASVAVCTVCGISRIQLWGFAWGFLLWQCTYLLPGLLSIFVLHP